MIPKEIKYNRHYDDVQGDFLRPPQAQHQLLQSKIKVKKGLSLETKKAQIYKNRRLGLTVYLHMHHTQCLYQISKS